jgi:peroxiredoxin
MKWRSLEESVAGADCRSLREQLIERKELSAKYLPAETRVVHGRVVSELKERRVAEGSLAVGAVAPGFELQDQNGKVVSSSELRGQGGLVICIFRGRWCPYCVGQLEAMNLVLPQIREAGANLVAISPQTVQQSFFMADQHRLQFPLLSDAGNRVARQFGIVYGVPEYQQAVYRRAFINLPFVNRDDSWELPVPATFVLGRDGTVVFASVNEDYTERPEPSDILQRLRF